MPTLTFTSAHGLTMLSALPLPVYRDATTGNLAPADATSAETHVDFYVTAINSTTSLEVEFSGLHTVTGHGLNVGEYYYLSELGSYSTAPNVVDQPIWYVIDANTIKLLDIRPIIRTCNSDCLLSVKDSELTCLLGINTITTKQQVVLDMAKDATLGLFEDYLKNNLGYEQHTEFHRVGQAQNDYMFVPFDRTGFTTIDTRPLQQRAGLEMLALGRRPVWTTGLRVWVDYYGMAGQKTGSFSNSQELTIGNDFYLDVDNEAEGTSKSGILHLTNGVWPMNARSIKVQYYSGNKTLPKSIKSEFIKNIIHNYTALNSVASNGGQVKVSENVNRYSYTLDSTTLATFGNMNGWSLLPSTIWALANSGLKSYRYM